MPQTVTLCVFDRLVDVSRPGDKIEITGIYRASPLKANPTQRVLKSIYRTCMSISLSLYFIFFLIDYHS